MREQPRHRDADRARHLHVVDAGADHRAQPRALHQQIERERGDDRDADHDQPVARERDAGDDSGRRSVFRRRHRYRIAAPHHQAEVGDDERDAERDQHLPQRVAGERAQDEALEQPAEQRDREPAEQRGQPQVGRRACSIDTPT